MAQGGPVRAGDADGHALASFKFGGIRCLIVVPRVGSYVIDIAVLVLVEFRQTGIELRLEGLQIHSVGIEYLFIHDFLMVPAFLDMYLVGVSLLCLLAAAADDVGVLPVVDAVSVAVILVVELLYTVSRPSGISFRVGESLFPLRGIGIKTGVARFETGPLTAVQDAVVVRGRVIVTQ